jgi:protein-L-isoaspartate(D-aspartate) O-methyltransferase
MPRWPDLARGARGGLSHDDDDPEIAERKMRFLFALRTRGVTDPRVLTAMERIDRGEFVRGHFEDRAYEDTPLPIPAARRSASPRSWG